MSTITRTAVAANTLTRAEIARRLQRGLGVTQGEAARIVETAMQLMVEALARGENVKLSGFGTFLLRDKRERIGRNPKTGVEVPIAPRRVISFRASQILRDRLRHG